MARTIKMDDKQKRTANIIKKKNNSNFMTHLKNCNLE